jgi:hypothetical protein
VIALVGVGASAFTVLYWFNPFFGASYNMGNGVNKTR